MSSNLRAAFTLTLEDRLSAGLDRIKQGFDTLRGAGRNLSLGRLENAGDTLRQATQEAQGLTRALHSISSTADHAWTSLKRVGSAMHDWGAKTFGAQSRIGALGAVAQGYSVLAPVHEYASLEDELRRIGIMKGLSGAALEAEIKRLTRFLGHEALATGQTSHAGAETYIDLIKAGTPMRDVEEILAAHHRAATAFYTDPKEFTKVTAALNNQFKVPHAEMDQALSAVGLAANLGMMTVANMGQEFPRIAGLVTSKGMVGREMANKMLAMMQTQMLTSGLPSSAAAEVFDGIAYLYSQSAMHHFEGNHRKGEVSSDVAALMNRATGGKGFSGVNLFRFLRGVEASGGNPIEAMLDKLQHMKTIGKLTEAEMGVLMGSMFGNHQALNFWQTQLNMREKRRELEARLNGVDPAEANRMFQARYGGPEVQLRLVGERAEQLKRRLGEGFLPVLRGVSQGMEGMVHGMESLDKIAPGVANVVLAVVGGMLGLGAALGAIGVAMPWVSAGFSTMAGLLGLVLSPLGISLGAIGLAAYDVVANWSTFAPFFMQMWTGVKDVFSGFGQWLRGWFTDDMTVSIAALQKMWDGYLAFYSGLFGTLKTIFNDLVATLDGWTGGAITATFERIATAIQSVIDKINEWLELLKSLPGRTMPNQGQPGSQNPMGDANPWADPTSWGGARQQGELTINVRADPGTEVTRIEGQGVRTNDAGRVLGRA